MLKKTKIEKTKVYYSFSPSSNLKGLLDIVEINQNIIDTIGLGEREHNRPNKLVLAFVSLIDSFTIKM